MENALNDSNIVYQWSIKINKTSDSDQGINIGIASDPFSKPIGNCCDSSYDYSHVFKKKTGSSSRRVYNGNPSTNVDITALSMSQTQF